MAEQQIIIKKSDDHDDHDHHGGAWKVAYADFMTAMMAFFLMLWIISAADEEKLQGLAEYFTPAEAADIMGGQGFLDGQVFGPDGVFAGVDGQNFQIQPPSFGREEPVSPPSDAPRDSEPRVVVEYADGPAPDRVDDLDPMSVLSPAGEEQEVDPALLAERAAREARLDEVTQEIEAAVATNLALVEMESNLRIDRTPDGLLIQILDQENRPMFASGSARIDAATRALVQIIGLAVADLVYPLAITGHTDSVPFTGRAEYGNWELSADRANATRRELLNAGVAERRISRVSGLADTMPLNATAPDAPENRRITMLLIYPDPVVAGDMSDGAAGAANRTESVD
jgi:chemotaxis protein MotB